MSIKWWFFVNADKPGTIPQPKSVDLKIELTHVHVTSYPRPNPETLRFGASLGDPAERPTEPTLMEVWWVDGVV